MTEQTTPDELDIKAINAGADAIRAAVRKDSPDLVRLLFNGDYEEWAAVAIKAAGEVFEADRQEFIDAQVAEAAIAGWDMSAEGMELRVTMARESAAGLVMAAKTFLDANPGATNYVEQAVIDRETGDRYVIVFQKPGGKTPHELRRQAEAERDTAREVARGNKRHVAYLTALIERVAALTLDEDGEPKDPALILYVGDLNRALVAQMPHEQGRPPVEFAKGGRVDSPVDGDHPPPGMSGCVIAPGIYGTRGFTATTEETP